jgi:hypothetical protein
MPFRLFLLSVLTICFWNLPVGAQHIPQGEMFVGFAYTRLNDLTPRAPRQDAFGVNLQGVFNLNKTLGIVGDFGGHYDQGTNLYTFMGGPRVHLRGERITPFAHVLVGGARASRVPLEVRRGVPVRFGGDSGLAVAVGGGLDVRLSDLVSLRAIQGEYLLTRIGGSGQILRDTQSHLRLGFGVNFTFGKRQ